MFIPVLVVVYRFRLNANPGEPFHPRVVRPSVTCRSAQLALLSAGYRSGIGSDQLAAYFRFSFDRIGATDENRVTRSKGPFRRSRDTGAVSRSRPLYRSGQEERHRRLSPIKQRVLFCLFPYRLSAVEPSSSAMVWSRDSSDLIRERYVLV